MTTGHDSRAIANIMVEKAQAASHRLTIMPLVKYVYLAHGWTLGYIGEPLIRDKVEAWKFGPVVPEVYEAFRPQGLIISKFAADEKGERYTAKLSEDEEDIVGKVYDAYSVLEPWDLSNLTHGVGSPWHKYRDRYWCEIPRDEIQTYYEDLVKKVREKHGGTSQD